MIDSKHNNGKSSKRLARLGALALAALISLNCAPWVRAEGIPHENTCFGLAVAENGMESVSAEEMLESDHEAGELIIGYKNNVPSIHDSLSNENGDDITLAQEGVIEQEALSEETSEGFHSSEGDSVEVALAKLEDDSDEAMLQAIESLSQLEEIAYVEPNYSLTLQALPDDPYRSEQYYLDTCGFFSAWDSTKSEGRIVVAVIDSGCNLMHEDLKGQVLVDYAYDVISGKPLAEAVVRNNGDDFGHGTNACGVIAAQANNATGIAGTSWNASLLPIRIFQGESTSVSYLSSAFSYLDDLLAMGELADLRVINMSFGGYDHSNTVKYWVDRMYSRYGILNVAAAGNGDKSTGKPLTEYSYPADYNSCLSVTSVSADGKPSAWSDYNEAKDIAAPGESILTTGNRAANSYVYSSGTSFSAPIVSGAAALMFSKYPSASAFDVVKAMQATATKVEGQPSISGSAGMLNVANALDYLRSNISGKLPSAGIGSTTDYLSPYGVKKVNMYRMYNPNSGEHFYTANLAERSTLMSVGWKYEGIAWRAPVVSKTPVYRMYSGTDHHYTSSIVERNDLVKAGWKYEGIGWYSDDARRIPLYRQFNPYVVPWAAYNNSGSHNYTGSLEEQRTLVSLGWKAEGIGWFGAP